MLFRSIKRVFITGGPGSFLCGVDERLRSFFKDTDNSDITSERQWIKGDDIWHVGAHFNLNGEFGDWMLRFQDYTKEQIIDTLDSVFVKTDKSNIIRFHKGHYFAFHLDKIVEIFPDATIICVNPEPWVQSINWVYSGGFDIPYPPYTVFNNDYQILWEFTNQVYESICDWGKRNNHPEEFFDKEWVLNTFPREKFTRKFITAKIEESSKLNNLFSTKKKNMQSLIKNIKIISKS